jgi:general secretion pathway protein G
MLVPERQYTERWRAKRRILDRLAHEYALKKAALQSRVPPTLFRNPRFYFGAIVVFLLLGAALFNATDSSVQKGVVTPPLRALRNLDVMAEALGRYRFHTGQFPDREQGLAALVRDPKVPRWNGPYINQLRKDPWGTAYVYEPASGGVPALFSCGPDKRAGTPDDLRPDPARFEPGTQWTNGWVSAADRMSGVIILPRASDKPSK